MAKQYLDKAGVEQLWAAVVAKSDDLELSYNAKALEGGDGMIKLTNKKGDKVYGEIDAAPFIKDGMLDDVSIVVSSSDLPIQYNEQSYTDGTKFIKFTWNAASGEKTDFIKLDEIGAVYTGTDSIDISSANKISVKKVGADKTTTSADIPVAGGPLAKLLNEAGITSIAADTNIQDVLMKLLCKELFADAVSTSDATLVSTVDAPVITMSTSTVEVGTPVHYKVTNGASGYTATPHKASGLSYGYSTTDNDTKEYPETSVSAEFGLVTVKDNSAELTISGAASGTQVGNESAASATLEGDITANSGLNTLTARNTSATYQGNCGVLNKVYACSNLGTTDESHVSTQKESVDLVSQSVSGSVSKSFSGKYKFFAGSYKDATFENKVYSSDSIRTTDMSNSDWMNGTSVDLTIVAPAGVKGVYFAIPEGIDDLGATLKAIQTSAMNLPATDDFKSNIRTVSVTCGGSHNKNYKVFTWSLPGGTKGEETFHITKF